MSEISGESLLKSRKIPVYGHSGSEQFPNNHHMFKFVLSCSETRISSIFHPDVCLFSNKLIFLLGYLSRGVLPENLRRGPYAVAGERC